MYNDQFFLNIFTQKGRRLKSATSVQRTSCFSSLTAQNKVGGRREQDDLPDIQQRAFEGRQWLPDSFGPGACVSSIIVL